ncbi:unnamed protein product [Brassica napus]|uniref:(rape) hypothetical protein n=1 Tax=Brassica napus TaxID=3708 RepID=A0A816IJA7_BRANA|nr:unnamed protein product [Brassica napus]
MVLKLRSIACWRAFLIAKASAIRADETCFWNRDSRLISCPWRSVKTQASPASPVSDRHAASMLQHIVAR